MEESQRRRSARLRCAAGILLWTVSVLAHAAPHLAAEPAARSASPAEVAASLARGAAWIWPDSNGPHRPRTTSAAPAYRDAAVLVESLVLRGVRVERGGRTQPLALPVGVRLMPVVHVESAADAPDDFTPAQRAAVLAAVRRHGQRAAGLLQLDFEAPPRQREAYRALVAAARAALPAGVRLSVTALAHWCTQGDWLDRLSVDEVVPMLYRLGPHAQDWRRRFERGDASLARRCRGPALGFATNDPPSPVLLARAARPYWFDETAWSNPSRPPSHLIP
ncbi:hypothetical protein ASD35_06395 [Pelomonas sp. Root1444]|nr:hypothetical protein ASD35_06395 [Pelomonas sp. Root1444]